MPKHSPAPAPLVSRRHSGSASPRAKGARIYLATPRLRGLMVMEMAVAAAGAMVWCRRA